MNFKPLQTDENILIFPGAQVLGDVTVGERTSFWFNCVCRAEDVPVYIGKRCNIQDLAMIHNQSSPVHIGDDVSVGHSAIIHGATVGDRVIVGMGAVLLDGARIGNDCIVGAGAVVTGKMDAPDGSLLVGNPARIARTLTDEDKAYILANSKEYLEKSEEYRKYVAEAQA